MQSRNNILFLKVSGKSQLDKEMIEMNKIRTETVVIDESAIHRNEITNEVEP